MYFIFSDLIYDKENGMEDGEQETAVANCAEYVDDDFIPDREDFEEIETNCGKCWLRKLTFFMLDAS